LKSLKTFTSKITLEMELFITRLNKKEPEKKFALEANEKQMHWTIKWKSSKNYSEFFEIEIWSDNNNYTLRGEHVIDSLFDQVNEPYLLYENKSDIELISEKEEILKIIKTSVIKITYIN